MERLRERHEVHPSELERLGSLDGDFDAVLWFDDGTLGVDSTVDLLKPRLAGGGRLIYVAPLNSAEPEVTRQRGALPSRHQLRLRQAVQALSEAGLAIARDHSLRSDEEGAGGPAGGFKVLVTRRDPLLMRAYRAGDEAAIMGLFRRCFHVDRGIDHWRWKYAENPYGVLRISLATTPEGQLVAHYGGYPVPVWRDGASFVALQMGDTMTDPSYRDAGRGKGALLARTVRHFFSLHRDGSFGFYFGFNTGPIQRFCRWFIGGSQTHPVTYRTRPLVDAPA
ncbi:MAG: GNAT family N-acetyltransferase, partial [Acidobacteriota bacterium]